MHPSLPPRPEGAEEMPQATRLDDVRIRDVRPLISPALLHEELPADGAGVALLPNFHVSEHLRTGRLLHVFKGWAPPDLWLTLYYPPYQALPPRIASFSKFFEEQVAARMVTLD